MANQRALSQQWLSLATYPSTGFTLHPGLITYTFFTEATIRTCYVGSRNKSSLAAGVTMVHTLFLPECSFWYVG